MAGNPNLRVKPTPAESATDCAQFIAASLDEAIKNNGRATFAISGGNTPKAMFGKLAGARVDWTRVHLFWVDERCVPPDHEQSNYKMARLALIEPAGIPQPNVHRINGELEPQQAAAEYIEEIKSTFNLESSELPAFDLLHRGIGADAHTASLFPGEPLIGDRTGIAAAVWVEKMNMHRVTLLPGVLKAAKQTVIEAVGSDKAEPIYNVLYGPDDPFQFPCQIAARGSDRAFWFLDASAAANLQKP